MRILGRSIVSAVAAMAVGIASAQSGPWTDGEIIVRTTNAGQNVLYRINPQTGHGVLVTNPQYWGGGAGSMAFDPFRNGLLLNMSMPPDNPFFYRLWVVQHDGTMSAIPALDSLSLKALCPVGDGRVYYQRGQANPGDQINYLDAGGNVHTLMNASGTAPFSLPVEHVIYHAASNALIATNTGAAGVCGAAPNTIHRIPLSPNGSSVAGPVTCTSFATGLERFIGIDQHPNGSIFLTLNSGYIWDAKLITVDPVTLSIGTWAQVTPHDLDGGFYSGRLDRAIVLDDSSNVLWTYAAGQSGWGALLSTDVPVGDGSSGTSSTESMFEIDLLGPSCLGWTAPYGTGLAGSGGFVPALGALGCPDVGSPGLWITLAGALGGASGAFAAGFVPGAVPVAGGTLYVNPIDILFPITALGAPGSPGAGTFAIQVAFGDPGLSGLSIYLQAGFIDAGAVQGVSLTNGLRIAIE